MNSPARRVSSPILFAAKLILQSAHRILNLAGGPVAFAFGFKLGVTRDFAGGFLNLAFRLLCEPAIRSLPMSSSFLSMRGYLLLALTAYGNARMAEKFRCMIGGLASLRDLAPRHTPREPAAPYRSVAGNQRFTTALPTFHHHTISLERWSIKYGLRERRTALADWNSASYHYSASVVLALVRLQSRAGQTENAPRQDRWRKRALFRQPATSNALDSQIEAVPVQCCSDAVL